MRKCSVCGIDKTEDFFSRKNKRCKECVNEKARIDYANSNRREYKKAYYEKVLIRREEKRIADGVYEKKAERKKQTLENKKSWYEEKGKYLQREWRRKNKHKINEYQKRYLSKNTNTLLGIRLRTLIHVSLKGRGKKSDSTLSLTGCTIQELKAHLESLFQPGMTWENHSRDGWHIDHKIPCAAFDLADPEEQKRCFHYTNLQPLWAMDNIMKSDKILPIAA
jgi:hypothetical protein